MSKSKLLEDLKNLVDYIKLNKLDGKNIKLIEALKSDDINDMHRAMHMISRLELELKVDCLFEDDLCINKLGGILHTKSDRFKQCLIKKAAIDSNPEKTIEHLEKLAATKKTKINIIYPVIGIRIENDFYVNESLKIIKFENIRNSLLKSSIIKAATSEGSFNNHIVKEPEMALVMQIERDDILVKGKEIEEEGKKDKSKKQQNYLGCQSASQAFNVLHGIAELLSLVEPSPVIPVKCWSEFEDEDLNDLFPPQGSIGKLRELAPSIDLMFNQSITLNNQEVINLIESYLKINENERFNIGISRFNQSMHRHRFHDGAIDLSIALESIFGSDGNSEMTHKISTRLSRVIGGDADKKHENFSKIKKMYGIRSQVVHGNESQIKIGSKEIIKKSMEISSAAIKNILVNGIDIKKWDRFDLT